MKALEVIHLRTAGVVQACQHFYYSNEIKQILEILTRNSEHQQRLFGQALVQKRNFVV